MNRFKYLPSNKLLCAFIIMTICLAIYCAYAVLPMCGFSCRTETYHKLDKNVQDKISTDGNPYRQEKLVDEKVMTKHSTSGDQQEGKPNREDKLAENKESNKPRSSDHHGDGHIDTKEKERSPDTSDEGVYVLFTFTKAQHNFALQEKFQVTLSSLFRWASIPLELYIIGDSDSQYIAKGMIDKLLKKYTVKCKVNAVKIDKLVEDLHDIVKGMKMHLQANSKHYYGDDLFFLSIAIHRVMPSTMKRVIMLDADLKFNSDIKLLHEQFSHFTGNNVIGIARENQPVYRHVFYSFRQKNPGTRVGDPPPNGLTGFNSGVLLLDLEKLRHSHLYNDLLDKDAVQNLTSKFSFKGHLGDQDYFTLLLMEYEDLFYILPCGWNFQLCEWWRKHGYPEVFDQYFKCDGHIHIYHGNCNTPIPTLDWEKS